MNRRKTIEEIIAFLLLLYILPGCTPVADEPKQTNGLSGKIKSTQLIGFFPEDTMNLEFEYDYLERLSIIHISTSSGFESFSELNVTYETNKVSVLAGDIPLTGDIFYLNPGTNLIDSCDAYYGGTLVIRNRINRNASEEITYTSLSDFPPYINKPVIDSTVYESGHLNSFIVNYYDTGGGNTTTRYHFQYGTLPAHTNQNPYGLEYYLTFLGIYNHLSVDVLGIRFAIAPEMAISNHESLKYDYPNNYEQYEYRYPTFTDTLVVMRLVNILSEGSDDQVVINHYYP